MLSKIKLKSFKSGFSSMWTDNFQMFKLGLEKAEKSEIKLSTCCITEKAMEFQENIYFCFIESVKPLTVWITTNRRKFFKRQE